MPSTSTVVRIPQMKMACAEEEDFGVVPLIETPPTARKDPMLHDCFFGSGTCIPSPLFKRNPSVESAADVCEDSQFAVGQPSPYVRSPYCGSSSSSTPGTCSQTAGSPSSSPCSSSQYGSSQQWCTVGADIFSSRTLANNGVCASTSSSPLLGQWAGGSRRDEGWLEEWMDMNGIFDPSVEIACTEADIPSCCLHDQVTPELELSDHAVDDGQHLGAPKRFIYTPNEATQALTLGAAEQKGVWIPNVTASTPTRICHREPIDRKLPVKSYVFRPVSKLQHVELAGSPIMESQRYPRSAKIIKASSTVRIQDTAAEHTRERKKRSSLFISDKKREQNRSAAIRYRDKRRVEAQRMKEELHDLELRNVALKTTVSGLNTEIVYLKGILHDVIGS